MFYFLDDKWYQFFTDFEDVPILDNDLGVQHLLNKFDNPDNVLPVYLVKEKYSSFDVPYGAMQPGSRNVNTLNVEFYCQLFFNNDTLKFKMPKTLFADNEEDKIFWNIDKKKIRNYKKDFEKLNWFYNFFSDPHCNYLLFESSSYDLVMQNNLYIIKPINMN